MAISTIKVLSEGKLVVSEGKLEVGKLPSLPIRTVALPSPGNTTIELVCVCLPIRF